jgi:nitrile hydratase
MNSVHDTGGMQGYGPVPKPDPDEPVFHARWEARVFALQLAAMMLGLWKPGVIRASVESLPPVLYLSASYYEKWALGLERRLLSSGMVATNELAAGRALHLGEALGRPGSTELPGTGVPAGTRADSGHNPARSPPSFSVGQAVRAKNLNPPTHTRLPRYVRDHVGVVEAVRGVQSLPDLHVLGDREELQWVYAVAFRCRDLWGAAADPQACVSVDAWEAYLESA